MDRPAPPLDSASLDSPSLEPAAFGSVVPEIRSPGFWGAIVLFWVFFGFLIGNHLYFGMRSHGHEWSRIVVWQIGGAAAWILLTPMVLALGRRFPLRPGAARRSVAVHLGAAFFFATVRLIPLTWLSRRMDPFRPVPREPSFLAEYRALLTEWLFLDVLVYLGVLLFGAVLASRRLQVREQLRASHLRAELAAAQLRALELEIRPHFLFNALNALNSLVLAGERERASAVLVGLADLLRATLKQRGRQLVPLEEEIALARAYLEIQKVRFGDRLVVEVDVDEGLGRAPVPGLVLQPLVENAVRHGLEGSSRSVRILIAAHRRGNELSLQVADDGPGLGAPHPAGVGLANVRSRLEALYGAGASLELGDRDGGGARVEVRIPAHPSPGGELP